MKNSISIYTTAYNLKADLFDYRKSLIRFFEFADEVVVATNSIDDYAILESLKIPFLKIVLAEIPFTDYAFDGKLKNAALQSCTSDFCILLDLDEYIPRYQNLLWKQLCTFARETKIKAFLIPVIDLFKDHDHYKSIGYKWYLHQREGCFRGVVNFAKQENGKIDTSKSDTTELIDENGELIPATYLVNPGLSAESQLEIMSANPIFVVHEGWLNKDNREKQNSFWKPHWENRSGKELIDKPLEEIYSETARKHYLWI